MKKEDFVLDSEYLTTQLVVVPKYVILSWFLRNNYFILYVKGSTCTSHNFSVTVLNYCRLNNYYGLIFIQGPLPLNGREFIGELQIWLFQNPQSESDNCHQLLSMVFR